MLIKVNELLEIKIKHITLQTNKTKNTMALSSKELGQELMEIAKDCVKNNDTLFVAHFENGKRCPDVLLFTGYLEKITAIIATILINDQSVIHVEGDSDGEASKLAYAILSGVLKACDKNYSLAFSLMGALKEIVGSDEEDDDDD